MKRYIIVVAGGKGLRMGGDTPKQFMLLNGKPLVMATIENLCAMDVTLRIVLVLPKDQMQLWDELCEQYNFTIPVKVVAGGTTRFHSVQNGLAAIEDSDEALVGVHDGVRPFLAMKVYDELFREAAINGAVVPVVAVYDSMRRFIGGQGATEPVPRDRYRLVQTPQVFKLSMLRKAYEQRYMENFTDDASVVEAMGEFVHVVEGNRENIKITTPFDFVLAKAIVECLTQQPET
ncbi:MAG: 2-C-methyl-D-erythritol 4-phosphate cytidylyltransferase [Bacteroidaceae bacterium]|nr:2-C-methyl-D-erythritol 4-phosphate cytidylyltransferase [Bacteroidaceae bacterium]